MKPKQMVPASVNKTENKHRTKICFRHNLNKGICEIIISNMALMFSIHRLKRKRNKNAVLFTNS